MAEQESPQPQGGEVPKIDADFRFLALVMSLTTAAWAQLGKMPHPQSQKIEKDLTQAKMSIDFLQMLLEKTKGNLRPKEHELLSTTVADLQLNYADEASKEERVGNGSTEKAADIITP